MKNKKWYKKITNKFRLVILNDQTFEEQFNMRMNTLVIIVFVLSISVVMLSLTFLVIAKTPLKEYIPGYPNVDQRKQIYELNLMADSLLYDIRQKDKYIQNIKNILQDKIPEDEPEDVSTTNYQIDSSKLKPSVEDSLLRAEFEYQDQYNLYFTDQEYQDNNQQSSIRNFNFFPPINGVITAPFNLAEKHYGIDIVTAHNEATKATLDGTVIYAGWTLETGYTIIIQHRYDLVSVYKHNSVLLKKEGDYVHAGDPIAIAGNSGELSTGPHLHFELWYNGTPVNPEEYIIFN